MSIVSSAAADGFIQRLPKEIRFYLVHGLDEGLTHERVKAIIRSRIGDDSDPMRLVRLEGDAVARDPGALADEAYAISMFGGERVIWIDAQGRDLYARARASIRPSADRLHDCHQGGTTQEGNGFKGRVRKFRARAHRSSAIPTIRAPLKSLIDAEARAAGLAITADARAALVHMVGADRRTTRGEIAKLMLYARGHSQITVEDVEAIVADAAPSNLDQVIDDALLGDLPTIEASLSRFFHEGGDADYLMIRLVARLTLLHRLRIEMDQGRPFEAACQALFVKLPMSARRALARQAERWTTASIAERLPAIRLASARVRTELQLAEVLTTRALWTLASRSRGARR